ncbi:ankyrin repeat domain-containing protein [Streptomyces sp. NPDC059894]|uniref:ankyrin repeat domain-containing protein n=1 Tax=unclassified Streptomyces TaxID=2593676 RepID=UPI0036557377
MSEAPDPEVVELATKIFDLARRGQTEALVAYVDAGVPANLTNDRGDTLVMLAAYHGHADAVRALLARGADADRINDRGQTPLAGAAFKGETEVVKALLEAGADPAAGTPSAVDTARMFARTELLQLFGASDADPPEQP